MNPKIVTKMRTLANILKPMAELAQFPDDPVIQAAELSEQILSLMISELPGIPPKEAKRFEKPSLLAVIDFCKANGIPDADAGWFWNKCEGNGWKNGGKAIVNWQATLRSWKLAGYLPSQKATGYGMSGRGGHPMGNPVGSAASMTLAENQTQKELVRARREK